MLLLIFLYISLLLFFVIPILFFIIFSISNLVFFSIIFICFIIIGGKVFSKYSIVVLFMEWSIIDIGIVSMMFGIKEYLIIFYFCFVYSIYIYFF